MWKPVTEYEGIYEVSINGEIRNIEGKILKTFIINSGYESISLYKNGIKKNLLVHRLVAREFCDGYSAELEVDHINNNRLDNRAINLRWITRSGNIQDCVARGVNSIEYARTFINNSKKVAMICPQTNKTIRIFDSINEAVYFLTGTVKPTKISAVCKGTRNKALGFYWKYVEDDIV